MLLQIRINKEQLVKKLESQKNKENKGCLNFKHYLADS